MLCITSYDLLITVSSVPFDPPYPLLSVYGSLTPLSPPTTSIQFVTHFIHKL